MRSLLIVASAVVAASMPSAAHDHAPGSESEQKSASTQMDAASAIAAAVAAPSRTPANVERDRYRHPAATLSFFGVKPGDTIVELFPGGGWYTEILAPLSRISGGTLYAAGPWDRMARLQQWQTSQPDVYGAVKLAEFPSTDAHPAVPDASADVVLTFRNVHNWRFGGTDKAAAAFREIYAMLKPGGILGVVEHRLDEQADGAREEKSGYMKESSVIAFAEAAGFQLAQRSDINANPKDTKDYPKGVWTLPPGLAEKDVDRAKYLAIGESDRMTLKFVKPAS